MGKGSKRAEWQVYRGPEVLFAGRTLSGNQRCFMVRQEYDMSGADMQQLPTKTGLSSSRSPF